MRPLAAVVLAALVLAPPSVFAQAPPATAPAAPAKPAPKIDKACPAGANVTMDLSAGEYIIKGSPDARLRVWWVTRNPADASKVDANADVSGNEARMAISGPDEGFLVTIEIPAASNPAVSLSAGKLTLEGVGGNIDVSAWAGEMNVGVADPANYKSAYASVTAGEIQAHPFGTKTGGVFRSMSWEGKGTHSVRVKLTAGKISLYRPAH
jgi:hypothetical protein